MTFLENWWMLEPPPGQAKKIIHTDVSFRSLADWLDVFHALDERPASSKKNADVQEHLISLPRSYIRDCRDIAIVIRAIQFVEEHQPPRGQRENHPTTAYLGELQRRKVQLTR